MAAIEQLRAAVDESFVTTADGLDGWDHPHPDRSPLDEEYSRVTDPQKWRIVNARVEAWVVALLRHGLATVERDVDAAWSVPLRRDVRVDRLTPTRSGAIPLLLAHAEPEEGLVAGVTLAIGDPAVSVAMAPDCGCDACDSGSAAEIDAVDDSMLDVVLGAIRHLSRRDRTVISRRNGWSASGQFRRGQVAKTLQHPRGWDEISGAPWIEDPSLDAALDAGPGVAWINEQLFRSKTG